MRRVYQFTILLMLLGWCVPASAQVSYVGAGALGATQTTADATATAPAGTVAGDIAVVYCWVRNTGDTMDVSGYTQIPGSQVDTATGSHSWWWRRLTGAAGTATCNKSASADSYARQFAFRGVVSSGNPWNAVSAGQAGTPNASGIYTGTGITTGAANSMVVVLSGYEDNDEASVVMSSTSPVSYTTVYAESATGNDGSISMGYAVRSTAGATGTVTIDYNTVGGSDAAGTLVLSLQPAPPPPPPPPGALSFVNGCQQATGATTVASRGCATTLTSGNFLWVGAEWNCTTGTPSVSDTLGHTFTAVTGTPRTWGTAANSRVGLWYAENVSGGSDTITVTYGCTSGWTVMYAGQFGGVSRSGSLDQVNFTEVANSGNPVTSGGFTTGTAEEVIINVASSEGAPSGVLTAGAGFSAFSNTSNSNVWEYRIVNSAGAYASSYANAGTGRDVVMFTATFRAAPVSLVSDLTVSKTHSGSFVLGQTGALYTITVANSGGAATSGTVTMQDTLPAGLTPTAMNGTGWACTLATLTCTRSDALAPGASYPAITLTVDVAGNAPSSVTNTATVSGGGETNTSNDTASDLTAIGTINPPPDLTIIKTHSGNFVQGQIGATYSITVTNSGGLSTSGTVTVTDTLPASLTGTAISGTGWTCTLATLTCTRSNALAAGASYPAITLTVNVASSAPASVTNTATVSGGGETNTSNDTANDVTTISASPLLTLGANPTTGFISPLGFEVPGDSTGRIFIIQQAGTIRIIQGGAVVAGNFLDITTGKQLESGGEKGLLGLTFHPSFSVNRKFYVYYTRRVGSQLQAVIAEYLASVANPNQADVSSERILLTVDKPFDGHNGGQLTFGPDGFLYIAVGDGGSADDPLGNGQNANVLLGKILRIDVNSSFAPGKQYAIPADNPFVASGGAPEVYAYGLRNPWRFSFDRGTGRLFIGDVGQGVREEVDIGVNGGNFGWNIMEGSICRPPTTGCNTAGMVLPIADYDHSAAGGASIIGGFVYRGTAIPALVGTYVFGDLSSGHVWGLTQDAGGAWQRRVLFDHNRTVSAFGQDAAGELYLVDYVNGQILPLVAAGPAAPDLTITKNHVGSFVQGQTGAAYSIAVTNGGGLSTSGTVTVTDTLPASLTATGVSGTGWTCTLATLICTRSNALAAGASYPAITLTVNVAANAPSSVTNTATVSGGGETNTVNDTVNDVTVINAPPPPGALSFVNGCQQATGATTVASRGCATTLTSGNFLWVGAEWNCTTGTPSVSDTLGHTFTAVTGTPRTWGTAANSRVGLWYAENVSGGSDTITVTYGCTSGWTVMYAGQFGGVSRSGSLDQVNFTEVANSGNPVTSGGFTTGTAEEVIINVASSEGAPSGVLTAGAGFSAFSNTSNSNVWEYRIVNSAGAYASSYANAGTGRDVVMFTATFRAAAGSTGGTYNISGTVSPSGPNAATVAMTGAATASTTTTGAGTYIFPGLANGAYNVRPSNTGYMFSPVSRDVTISGANATGVDFTATPQGQTFSISGTVTSLGSGAVVSLSGAASTTTVANSAGAYTLTGLGDGTYTVTPAKTGYVFSPSSQTVTISGAGLTGVSFSAAVAPPSSVTISISPASTTLVVGATKQFIASVTGSANTAVTWSANSGTVSTNGQYTAPTAAGTYAVVATSVADSTKSASAIVAVAAAGTTHILLGNQILESHAGSVPLGQAVAFQTIANITGNVQTVTVYLDATSSVSKLVLGLYRDNNNHPGALLSQGSTTQLTAGAWNSIAIQPTAVAAGQPYWIAILGVTSGTLVYRHTSGEVCASETGAESSLLLLPSTWTTGAPSSDCRASVFGSWPWAILDRPGDGSNNEQENYHLSNVTASGGFLALTSRSDPNNVATGTYLGGDQPSGSYISCVLLGGNSYRCTSQYSSGYVLWNAFNQQYGDFQIRAKLGYGWPAIWMMGSDCQASHLITPDNLSPCNWKATGSEEIDIAEGNGVSQGTTVVTHHLHSNSTGDPSCATTNLSDITTNYHVYEVLIANNKITWFVDGVQACSINRQSTDRWFLMMNVAIGGSLGGNPTSYTYPNSSSIDWVKVCDSACANGIVGAPATNGTFFDDFTSVSAP